MHEERAMWKKNGHETFQLQQLVCVGSGAELQGPPKMNRRVTEVWETNEQKKRPLGLAQWQPQDVSDNSHRHVSSAPSLKARCKWKWICSVKVKFYLNRITKKYKDSEENSLTSSSQSIDKKSNLKSIVWLYILSRTNCLWFLQPESQLVLDSWFL